MAASGSVSVPLLTRRGSRALPPLPRNCAAASLVLAGPPMGAGPGRDRTGDLARGPVQGQPVRLRWWRHPCAVGRQFTGLRKRSRIRRLARMARWTAMSSP